MSRFSAEQAIEDFQNGKIDEYDLRRELKHEYGSCSCIGSSITRAVRDAEYGGDSISIRNRLDSSKRRCDLEDQQE